MYTLNIITIILFFSHIKLLFKAKVFLHGSGIRNTCLLWGLSDKPTKKDRQWRMLYQNSFKFSMEWRGETLLFYVMVVKRGVESWLLPSPCKISPLWVVYVIAYHAPPLWSCDLYDWSYDSHLFCDYIMLLHVILWLYDWSHDALLFCNHIMLLHVILWSYIWTYDDHQCDAVIPWYDYLRNMKWLDDFDMII